MGEIVDKSAIRDAATIIVVRGGGVPSVLMGQRGASAAFMPNKYVFPGGAVDTVDSAVELGRDLSAFEVARLERDSTRPARALAAAAIRELWEETGQILGTAADWQDAPQGWRGFARAGFRPDASALQFVFRAVTPMGRPRRFDARFFMVDAAHLVTDADDFSNAEDELRHLHWVPLNDARALDLPRITEFVLDEVAEVLKRGSPSDTVPYFRNNDEEQLSHKDKH